MKKVLSVLLAAAMVMGMSVSAFADQVWGKGPQGVEVTDVKVSELSFSDIMTVVHNDGSVENINMDKYYEDEYTFIAGDVLWFPIHDAQGRYTGPIDSDWTINIKDNNYVSSAEFATYDPNGNIADSTSEKSIKIKLDATYDDIDDDDVDFYFYIADTDKNYAVKRDISKQAEVHYLFDNWLVEFVDFDFMNDVDYMTKWVTEEGKAGKGTAAFSFNKEAYYVVKMIPEEEVIFNFSSKYDKDLDKAYGYDADLAFYNFKGTKDNFNRVGDVIIPADDDTFVYEVVNGKAVEVEAEYVEDYEVIKGTKVDGWVIETNELGYYIVSDIELEIEAEAEDNTNSSTSTDKTNPETGANDFVGAAVALAVVSVAAAGALAFKK